MIILADFHESLGRWLCYQYYRDPRGLQQIVGVHEIFEDICRLDHSWYELLAGAYRYPQLSLTQRKGNKVKWSRLGEVVRPGLQSIDGIGDVRAKEVLMYLAVAERFEELMRKKMGP